MHSNNVMKKGVKPGRRAHVHAGWRPDFEVVFLVGIIVATLLLVSPAMAQDGEAQIRMAHLSPDAPAVMVELDGEPVEDLASVSYRDSSPYLTIPAGPHEVAVFAVADPSEPVLEVSISPEAGSAYTVAGVGLLEDDTFGARLFEDDLTDPDEGEARVRVIHAIPDVGPATVGVQDGPDLFALPGFANASDYADVEAGTYTLEVTPSGDPEPAFDVPDVEVEEGEVYTAFAIGQASEGTIATMLTVDSDDGRLVGPTTLEDTSGDLSLLEDPQPEGFSSPISPKEEPKEDEAAKEPPKEEAPKKEAAKEPTPKQNAEPESAASEASENVPPAPVEEAPVEEAPVESAPAERASAEVAPESTPAPISEAPVESAPAPVYTPTYTSAPPAGPTAPPVVENAVAETAAADTGYVPQPAPVAPAVSQIPVPEVPVSQIPVPEISIPPVEAPPVPAVSGSWSSQTTASTQTITSGGTAVNNVASSNVAVNNVVSSGFAPAAPAAPVGGEVIGTVISVPAVVNSGARRKFVTIRREGSGRPE